MNRYLSERRLVGEGLVIRPAADIQTLDPAAYAGGQAQTDDGSRWFSDGSNWVSFVGGTRETLTKTVGAGGDFASLQEAVTWFGERTPSNPDDRTLGRILILSGHVCTTPVKQLGTDLSWVLLESEDADVPVANSAYAPYTFLPNTTVFYAFWQVLYGTAPLLNTHFLCNNTSWISDYRMGDITSPAYNNAVTGFALFFSGLMTPRREFLVSTNKTGVSGFSNNLEVSHSSRIYIDGAVNGGLFLDGRFINVSISHNSTADLRGVTIRSTGSFSQRRSLVVNFGSNCQILAGDGSHNSDIRRIAGVDSGFRDIAVLNSSIILIASGTLGGTSQASGVWTIFGLILDARVTTPVPYSGTFQAASYTVATVPSASTNPRTIIYVTDGDAGQPCLAVSDGTNWRRIAFGATISTT